MPGVAALALVTQRALLQYAERTTVETAMPLTRKDYTRFVTVIGNVHRHLHRTLQHKVASTTLDEITDTVQAQIALAFAEDNPKFNSFQFDTSCRKERELPWR